MRKSSLIPASTALLLLLGLCRATWGVEDIYDPYGNRVFSGRGTLVYELLDHNAVLNGYSLVYRSDWFYKYFKNKMIFTTARPGLTNQITVGEFRTKFTPLSLNKDVRDGLQWDILGEHNELSAVFAKLTNLGITGTTVDSRTTGQADVYLNAVRERTRVGLFEVGLSIVNSRVSSSNIFEAGGLLQGNVSIPPPSEIFIRFSDASPSDEEGGATLYGIRVYFDDHLQCYFAPGERIGPYAEADFLYGDASQSILDPVDRKRSVGGTGSFVYRFPVTNAANIKKVTFEVDIANDYLVEVSDRDRDYRVVLSAEGNVTNESNRRTRHFHYGIRLDDTIVGIDFQTNVLGYWISGEYTALFQHYRFPSPSGRNLYDTANSWYLKTNRQFGNMVVGAEAYSVSPDYNAAFAIDDNDDDDPYLDDIDPDDVLNAEIDRDRDGVADYEDDFLLFDADPPEFELGVKIDENNNGTPDADENDAYPDYPYYQDTMGFHVFSSYRPFSALSVDLGYTREKQTLGDGRSEMEYAVVMYKENLRDIGDVRVRHLIKHTRDTIPNDILGRDGRTIVDPLEGRNTIQNIFSLIFNYAAWKDFLATWKLKYQMDLFRYSKTTKREAMFIAKLKYDVHIGSKIMVTPMYRKDKKIGFSVPGPPATRSNHGRDTVILRADYYLIPELVLRGGYEYVRFRNIAFPGNSYARHVFSFEVANKAHYWNKDIGLIISYNYAVHDYLRHGVGGDNISSTIFVKAFVL